MVLVNRAAMYAMKKRVQTVGQRKWRIFSSGEELLLQELLYVAQVGTCGGAKDLLLHSFLITRRAPWVYESVTVFATDATTQRTAVLNGRTGSWDNELNKHIKCGVLEERIMARVGGGSSFKLVPLWGFPLRFAGFSRDRIKWKVKVGDCGSILVSFASRMCHKDITLPPRYFELKIDTGTGFPYVRADGYTKYWGIPQSFTSHRDCSMMRGWRPQIQMLPGFARTVHKTPGQTVEDGLVDISAFQEDVWLSAYVFLSRS